MKQPTAQEYVQYAQQTSLLRAQKEMEALRIIYAKYGFLLNNLPHLRAEIEKLMVVEIGRDYAALAKQIDKNLTKLEDWLTTQWQPALRQYPSLSEEWQQLSKSIDLYQHKYAKQKLPELIAIKKDAEERIRKHEQIQREAEERARKEEEERARLKAEECAQKEIEARVQREAEEQARKEAEAIFQGFEKIIGHEKIIKPDYKSFLITAPKWGALKDLSTGLVWAVNWDPEDSYPNRGKLSWYQSGVRKVQQKWYSSKMVEEPYTDGWYNDGENTEVWIKRVNQLGYLGYHDWRLPSVEELQTLLLQKNGTFDKERYKKLFTESFATGRFLSSSKSGRYIHFSDGLDDNHSNAIEFYVRLVRSSQ